MLINLADREGRQGRCPNLCHEGSTKLMVNNLRASSTEAALNGPRMGRECRKLADKLNDVPPSGFRDYCSGSQYLRVTAPDLAGREAALHVARRVSGTALSFPNTLQQHVEIPKLLKRCQLRLADVVQVASLHLKTSQGKKSLFDRTDTV